MKLTTTACCALGQISGVNNNTEILNLKNFLSELKKTSEKSYIPGDDSGEGQTSFFIITTPNEKPLENKLRILGFNHVHSFKRRNGYELGNLKMWIIKF